MTIQSINCTAADAGKQFAASLRETGFAVLTHHPIAEDEINQFYQAWQTFFEQDTAAKENFLCDRITQIGWVPPSISEIAKGHSARDLKEYFNFFLHGSCPEGLRAQTLALYDQMYTMAKQLLTWLQAETPAEIIDTLSQSLPSMVADSMQTLFRVNYYPSQTGTEAAGAVRAAAHADIDLITILTAGTQNGLQAKNINGDWVDIPAEHGNLIINAGDMLQECTQGYYPSTLHRVINPCENTRSAARMSCPLFVHPRPDVVLSERHTQASYLHERLVELGYRTATKEEANA
jgi:isopenicillin N synthase-like dioxygenase